MCVLTVLLVVHLIGTGQTARSCQEHFRSLVLKMDRKKEPEIPSVPCLNTSQAVLIEVVDQVLVYVEGHALEMN